ncbi:MAG: hypothetical protein IT377_09360 [Polyangiaceae bacterium]|nr:hypothetical protein [Polyangiaceae bacterium]
MPFPTPYAWAIGRAAQQLGAGVLDRSFGLVRQRHRLRFDYHQGSRQNAASFAFQAELDVPLDLGLSISSGATDVWGRFAQSFVSYGDEPARVQALTSPALQAALMAALEHTADVADLPRVQLLDNGVRILTAPAAADGLPFGDDGYLVHLTEAASQVALAALEAARHVPPAASLVGLARDLERVARDTGMKFGPTPLTLEGRRHGVECRLVASRQAPLTYQLVLEARFVEPLGLGLSLGDRVEAPDFLSDLFYASPRFETGDAAFDATFEVRVGDERRARAVLGDVARRQLNQLRRFGPFAGDDRGLTLRLPAVHATGESAISALGALGDAAAVLSGLALERRAGPYR